MSKSDWKDREIARLGREIRILQKLFSSDREYYADEIRKLRKRLKRVNKDE